MSCQSNNIMVTVLLNLAFHNYTIILDDGVVVMVFRVVYFYIVVLSSSLFQGSLACGSKPATIV